jgi:hypothetical protein
MDTNKLHCNYRAIPLLSAFPFPISFCSPFVSLYLLGTLLAVIGSSPPRSRVARKLISPFPSPYPYTPHSKIPTPWGLPDPNIHFIRTTSSTWLTRSRTNMFINFLLMHTIKKLFEINYVVVMKYILQIQEIYLKK